MQKNRILAILATVCSIAWLFVAFSQNALFYDREGKGTIIYLILIDCFILVIGLVALFASFKKSFPWILTVVILLTPILHYFGAGINAPGCYPFFIGPIALIIGLTIFQFFKPKTETTLPIPPR
jgi:hypothetical protein